MLCISTSEQMLRKPFDGQNQFFDAKTTSFLPLVKVKVVFVSKNWFRSAKGVRSTRSLVEIHNSHAHKNLNLDGKSNVQLQLAENQYFYDSLKFRNVV